MKSKWTLLTFLLAGFASQAQITINANDVPLPGTINLIEYSAQNQLSSGTNQNWDVSMSPHVGPTTINYIPETVPYWIGLGAEVYRASSKYLTTSLTYNIFQELDKTTSGFNEIGFNVPAQSYSISAFTNNTADSLLIPEQDITYTSPKTLIPFPFNSTSSFSSSGRRVVNFTINAPALGLNNTPFTHVMNEIKKDSVIGWGTLRVYTPNGISAPYDVLMDQIINYSLDSFYMAGNPAPPQILTTFGVTQGQKVTVNNAINFYRKGYFSYLFRLFYGGDNTFTTLSNAYSNTDGVAPLSLQNYTEDAYQTLVYPNPCTGNVFHIQVLDKTISEPTAIVTDMQGNQIQKDKLTVQSNGLMHLKLQPSMVNGNYTLTIIDRNNNILVKEIITVAH